MECICMNTNHEFFLMQLADSFFPSGMFGLSNGLESLAKHKRIRNEEDVLNFIEQQIEFQLLPCDCIGFLNAMAAAKNRNIDELVEVDNRFLHYFQTRLTLFQRTLRKNH